MTTDIPKFDELPVIEKLGLRHSWDVFGRDDNIGTINHLTPERVVQAASLVRTGEVFNLTWPVDEPNPPMYGRRPVRHTIYPPARNELDDYLDDFYLQGSSQWDGLRHVQAREFGLYTGVTDEMTPGSGRLGVEHWVEHGIVGRGVLVDVARHQESLGTPLVQTEGRSIEAEEIEAAARAQGVELRPGDVLCLRLGWPGYYETLSHDERLAMNQAMAFPGLSARESMARFLWDSQVAAVTCDNPSFEVSPGDPGIGYLHRRLIPSLGMAIGEFFRFDRLAAACAEESKWDFLFVSVPLHVRGGIGSPANAIAVR
jgi:kynurenine formamidase